MKKLYIITGPQGSGNHLWAKILSAHQDVFGWEMEGYWEGHHKEPFSKVWVGEQSLNDLPLKQYNITSISCPYVWQGVNRIPDYERLIKEAKDLNIDVEFIVIGRDENILLQQQTRVRSQFTTTVFLEILKEVNVDHFISTELLFLYKEKYLNQLSKQLELPIDIEAADEHIQVNTNQKYIKPAKGTATDEMVKAAITDSVNGIGAKDFVKTQLELTDLNASGNTWPNEE
tara:strand:+ start:2900 stop:3589 length:690 start_codon:yes stop_codon:yes gene_type:complete